MAAHSHTVPNMAVRRPMVAAPLLVFLATLPFLALMIVCMSMTELSKGPDALWHALGLVGGLGSYGVWLFLLVRPAFRRASEREFVRMRKGMVREQMVLLGIPCPTCQVSGAVQRSASVGQFSCGRCGFVW